MVGYKVKMEGLEELLKSLSPEKSREIMSKVMENTARAIVEEVRNLSPVRTGRLRGSWSYVKASDARYVIGSNVKYAPFVEFGTRPHVIYAKRARALRFEAEGETVFARYVRHPGTPAQRFVDKALRLVQNRFKDFVNNIITEVMKK